MAQHRTGDDGVTNGTASVTQGESIVTCVGGNWLTVSPPIVAGNGFKFQNENAHYNINSLNVDGTLSISPVYAGSTRVESKYAIMRDYTEDGLIEISPGDVDWAFLMTLNMRKITDLLANAGGGGGASYITLTDGVTQIEASNVDGILEWTEKLT